MKLMSIVGARPQFVKLAAIHRALLKNPKLEHIIVHTGQHYDDNMSAIFFSQLEIPTPQYNLNIQTLPGGDSIKLMCAELVKLYNVERPDIIVVFGDTNSTLAGAMAAHQKNTPLAHIEAGLRSFNSSMHEEYNRIETDKISTLLFCPTIAAVQNLAKEDLKLGSKVSFCGDVMFDNIRYYAQKTLLRGSIIKSIPGTGKYALATIHRENNVTSPKILKQIINALNSINKDLRVIMPVHPRTRAAFVLVGVPTNFILIDPVGYLDMLQLIKNCELVLTDSGGLQKEAFFCKKMCVTLREETEWTELVQSGMNILAGTSTEGIVSAFEKARVSGLSFDQQFYGDGNAADIITNEILQYLNEDEA